MSTTSNTEVARPEKRFNDFLRCLYLQECLNDSTIFDKVKEIEAEMVFDPNASCVTGNKTLDAFTEFLLRRTLAVGEDFDDDAVVFTPSSSNAPDPSASGNDAEVLQPPTKDGKGDQQDATVSLVGILANLLGLKKPPTTKEEKVDEAKPNDEAKVETMMRMSGNNSDDATTKPSQHTGSIFFGPDFNADLAKTAGMYVMLDIVILTPTTASGGARFMAVLIIFAIAKMHTLSKLNEVIKTATDDKAALEKAKIAVSCWMLLAMGSAFKMAMSISDESAQSDNV